MAQLPAMVKWLIWFALMSAVVTYFAVLQVVDSGEANSGELKNPLYVAGLLSAIASLGAKHFVRSRSVKEGRVVPFADQTTFAIFQDHCLCRRHVCRSVQYL